MAVVVSLEPIISDMLPRVITISATCPITVHTPTERVILAISRPVPEVIAVVIEILVDVELYPSLPEIGVVNVVSAFITFPVTRSD